MNATNSSTENTLAAIIEQLTPCTGRFPKKAVEAAIAHRDAITPRLLAALEEVANAPAEFARRQDYTLHAVALHLLAQFRDQRAYAPLVRIAAAPGEIPFDLLGDTITERLQNLLGSVYDGDPAPLQRLVEGNEVNEYVRGAAVLAFIVLQRNGRMSREEVSRYFQTLLRGGLTREHNHVWDELACAVADLPAPELLGDLRRAYAEGLIDSGYADLHGVERDCRLDPSVRQKAQEEQYALVDDAISEMSWWAVFDPKTPVRRPAPNPRSETAAAASRPAVFLPSAPVRREPQVGRNDPCPCGSGKKYKKCCLGRV